MSSTRSQVCEELRDWIKAGETSGPRAPSVILEGNNQTLQMKLSLMRFGPNELRCASAAFACHIRGRVHRFMPLAASRKIPIDFLSRRVNRKRGAYYFSARLASTCLYSTKKKKKRSPTRGVIPGRRDIAGVSNSTITDAMTLGVSIYSKRNYWQRVCVWSWRPTRQKGSFL